jgi:hypothetical protein
MKIVNEITESDARRILSARKAYRAAKVVEVFGWVSAIVSPIVGLFVATSKETIESESIFYADESSYPNITAGLTMGIVGLFYGVTVIMIAAYVQNRMSDDSIIPSMGASALNSGDPISGDGYLG